MNTTRDIAGLNFIRPCGTGMDWRRVPPLKRWAMVGCPYGTALWRRLLCVSASFGRGERFTHEISFGARPVPGRSTHEDTQAPGLTRSLPKYRSRCAPGRRALQAN